MAFVSTGNQSVPFPADPFPLLRHGSIGQLELIPWGSNYTFVTEVRDGEDSWCLAVYKPRRGEAPLRDFTSGTLYKREVAAYLLSDALGWNAIPPTIVREDAPHGIGSLQLYVQPASAGSQHLAQLRSAHKLALQRLAAFDLLANNADRKAGHCLLDVQNQVWGIDHGLTFHHVFKLRTVIWDFCGQDMPPSLVADLASLRGDPVRSAALCDQLAPYLSELEREALLQRWDAILERPCYPVLDPHRNVPWPPF